MKPFLKPVDLSLTLLVVQTPTSKKPVSEAKNTEPKCLYRRVPYATRSELTTTLTTNLFLC
eukprot:8259818-Karenia_brevis.AAC.1